MELPTSGGARAGAGRAGHHALEESALARGKKNAARAGRTIVFIDESGLSERPHRCRTWAPRGQTPVLHYQFHWNHFSVIAGITWWTFYFRLYPDAINAARVVAFLRQLQRHVPGKLLIVWDRLNAHRSALVRDFIAAQHGRIRLEWLPTYAPELNPVEYVWGHWKQHELPNFCPRDAWQLSAEARRALRRMRRRPSLIVAFWQQADLFV